MLPIYYCKICGNLTIMLGWETIDQGIMIYGDILFGIPFSIMRRVTSKLQYDNI